MSEQPKIIWTVVDIIKWGTDYFGSKGVDSPRLTIELLLSEVLQWAKKRMEFEKKVEKLASQYPAVKDAKEKLEIIIKLVEDSN